MNRRLEFLAARIDYGNRLDIVILQRCDGVRTAIAKPISIEMESVDPRDADLAISEATLSLDNDSAHSLMNSLWSAGLRPTDFKKEPNDVTFAALQAHLGDLRGIVHKLLKIEPK